MQVLVYLATGGFFVAYVIALAGTAVVTIRDLWPAPDAAINHFDLSKGARHGRFLSA